MAGSLGLRKGSLVRGRDIRDWIDEAAQPPAGGPGLLVRRAGLLSTIELEKNRKPPRRVQWDGRVVSSSVDSPNRWTYVVREVLKTAPGYGGWTDRTNGKQVTAFHRAEDINSSGGVQGHGVDIDNLPGDFATKPLPDGLPVFVTEVTLYGAGPGGTRTSKEYWIDSMNGIDGTCPS